MEIREATADDVGAMVRLSSGQRDRMAAWQPEFWRRHEHADHNQAAWFGYLLADDDQRLIVADRDGDVVAFLSARVMDAPPVYDPGGRTCFVDDLVGDDPDAVHGLFLLARQWAAAREATQFVVVTAAADDAARDRVAAEGLSVASEWWVGPV